MNDYDDLARNILDTAQRPDAAGYKTIILLEEGQYFGHNGLLANAEAKRLIAQKKVFVIEVVYQDTLGEPI